MHLVIFLKERIKKDIISQNPTKWTDTTVHKFKQKCKVYDAL